MSNQLSVETAVCSEHQRLLAECERALEIWNEHRAEFCQYARAYTVLTRHEHNCSFCQLVSREEACDPANSSDASFESIL